MRFEEEEDSMLQFRSDRMALIHLAKKQCCPNEESYRALLYGTAGVDSAKDIETEEQFNGVMAAFKALGFTRKPSARKALPVNESEVGGATRRQLYYIKGLWELASRKKDEESLKRMVKRIARVDDLRFLTVKSASAVILALRDICLKAGIDPDRPDRQNGGPACRA